MADSRCPRCTRGKLQLDNFENELVCVNCGYRRDVKATPKIEAVAKTQATDIKAPAPKPKPIRKIEKVPAPAELKRTVPYRASSILSSNGAWYPPNQISFRREQMIFLIHSLPLLQEGHYPRNPIGTGYVDNRLSIRRGRHNAYYESPAALAAEVETRLELCGQDGLMLEAVFCWGKKPEYLMRAFNLDEYKLMRRINSALAYISGWRRKERSYKDFRTHRKTVS